VINHVIVALSITGLTIAVLIVILSRHTADKTAMTDGKYPRGISWLSASHMASPQERRPEL
jgi:hypothetical protein